MVSPLYEESQEGLPLPHLHVWGEVGRRKGGGAAELQRGRGTHTCGREHEAWGSPASPTQSMRAWRQGHFL